MSEVKELSAIEKRVLKILFAHAASGATKPMNVPAVSHILGASYSDRARPVLIKLAGKGMVEKGPRYDWRGITWSLTPKAIGLFFTPPAEIGGGA